jgi:nucleoid DNA-binding protein
VTKKELIEAYKAKAGPACGSIREAQEQMERTLEVLAESLHREGKIRWDGFGTWEVRQRPAYKGRNPLTQEPIKIKASKTVAFKVASALRERVQKAPRKQKAA